MVRWSDLAPYLFVGMNASWELEPYLHSSVLYPQCQMQGPVHYRCSFKCFLQGYVEKDKSNESGHHPKQQMCVGGGKRGTKEGEFCVRAW